MLLNGVWVGWGKALRERHAAPGHLDADHLMLLARPIADIFSARLTDAAAFAGRG